MDPQRARDEAQKKRQQAEQLNQEADELESDADEREQDIQRLRGEIAQKVEEERQARNADDRDEEIRLTRELRGLEAELRNAQTGGRTLF